MSADSWSDCPVCARIMGDAKKSLYGRVSEEEYLAAISKKKPMENTLAEYYEFYWRDDALHMNYGASCAECGFEFSVKQEWPTDGMPQFAKAVNAASEVKSVE